MTVQPNVVLIAAEVAADGDACELLLGPYRQPRGEEAWHV
jgi:hypothetical protein